MKKIYQAPVTQSISLRCCRLLQDQSLPVNGNGDTIKEGEEEEILSRRRNLWDDEEEE